MSTPWILLLFQLLFNLASASQTFFGVPNTGIPQASAYDEGLFTPMEDMNALSSTTFSVLNHPAFPKYNVRIKKSAVCDDPVNAYTGYIDIEARHIFFYFFESRSDPDTDDMIFWTNGGPGCSASTGLFMELGPCRVSGNGTSFRPESWNTNANIFFVDNPIGVGFSYADYGESVSTTEEAAKDIAAFVFVFFEHFTKFKGRALHMAGESYGGHYLPIFGAEVYDQNTRLAAGGYTPINLTSIMIGNGLTDFYHQIPASYDIQCTAASVPPTLSIAECVQMKSMIPRCQKGLKESCVDIFDATDCAAAASFCKTHLTDPFWKSERNPYDITQPCDAKTRKQHACYPVLNEIHAYLSRPAVREMLGVDDSVPAKFVGCSSAVRSAFDAQMDRYRPAHHYVGSLLEHGVRVLAYAGTFDWRFNWVGIQRWTLALDWTGQAAFAAEPLRPWAVGGDFSKGRAGRARSAGGLTFVTIDNAGHMVPYDKPKEALDLVQRWLSGEGF
ncbi:serine carboxypeptidase [Mycena capillaripes]|nr:serine carboxypeptidase [Mycena capillaripes]